MAVDHVDGMGLELALVQACVHKLLSIALVEGAFGISPCTYKIAAVAVSSGKHPEVMEDCIHDGSDAIGQLVPG